MALIRRGPLLIARRDRFESVIAHDAGPSGIQHDGRPADRARLIVGGSFSRAGAHIQQPTVAARRTTSEDVGRPPVAAGRNMAEVLEAAEHALDGVPVAGDEGREAALPAPMGRRRDVRQRDAGLDSPADRIGVACRVGVDDPAGRHGAQERAVGRLPPVGWRVTGLPKSRSGRRCWSCARRATGRSPGPAPLSAAGGAAMGFQSRRGGQERRGRSASAAGARRTSTPRRSPPNGRRGCKASRAGRDLDAHPSTGSPTSGRG